jgi:hypothetical protein
MDDDINPEDLPDEDDDFEEFEEENGEFDDEPLE